MNGKEWSYEMLEVGQPCQFECTSELTRNNILGVHCIFILNEAKAVHQLDLLDGTSAMGGEVLFDVLFGD